MGGGGGATQPRLVSAVASAPADWATTRSSAESADENGPRGPGRLREGSGVWHPPPSSPPVPPSVDTTCTAVWKTEARPWRAHVPRPLTHPRGGRLGRRLPRGWHFWSPRCPRGHLVRGDAPFARGLGFNDKRCRKKGTRRRGAWGPRMSATSGPDDGGRGRGQRPWAAEQSCCAPSAQPGTRAWAGASSLPGPGTQGCGRAVLAARLGLGRPPPPALGRPPHPHPGTRRDRLGL